MDKRELGVKVGYKILNAYMRIFIYIFNFLVLSAEKA